MVTTVAATAGGAIDASDLFSKRDLKQSAELDEAVSYSVSDGAEISITAAGVNENFPVIYVKNADKVSVTTAEGSENSLSVTGTFTADGSTNTDAVIFSRDDLVLNGLGTLNISSTDNGIACKDDLKITGGTLNVSAADACIEANDSIAVAGGTITVTSSKKDGLHAENEDDDREGWIYICGGTLQITAADDGIHAVSIVQIDGGTIIFNGSETKERTWVVFV